MRSDPQSCKQQLELHNESRALFHLVTCLRINALEYGCYLWSEHLQLLFESVIYIFAQVIFEVFDTHMQND